MKRKQLSVLCLLLCVALLPIAGCEKKAATPTPIEFPVEGFTWGMTLEEAETIWTEKGLVPSRSDNSGSVSIGFALEDMIKLGTTEVAGMPFSPDAYNCAFLQFNEMSDGTYRLAYFSTNMTVPTEENRLSKMAAEELMNGILNKAYGKRPDDEGCWGTFDLAPVEEGSELTVYRVYPQVWYSLVDVLFNKEVTLSFAGAAYTEYLYGK